MQTEKQLWAKERNWLLLRLRGVRSVFGEKNRSLISLVMGNEKDVDIADRLIRKFIMELSAIDTYDKYIKLWEERRKKHG